jgi:alpha-1,3-rhamnosyl/mannosyltransferase
MRVLLHLKSTLGPRTGIGHHTAELYRCLNEQAPGEIIGAPPPFLRCLHGRLYGTTSVLGKAGFLLTRATVKGYPWLRLRLGRPFDVYHEPNFIPVASGVPTLATIHDLSVLLHPEWHPSNRVTWFENYFPSIRERCVHFFAVSESGRQEIIHTLGIPASRVTRTYNGIRPSLGPMKLELVLPWLTRLGLPHSYLLHVGTIEPRKNVLTLMQAYCDLPAALREKYPLILAGGWGWRAEEVADFFHHEARHRNVRRLGYVPEEALGAVYNGARALAFPSLYEGFGLPPVEMMACGGAVLASTAATVAEVAGGQAHLIEPMDVAGWREALRRVMEDDDWHEQLCRGAVEHARPFTWDACAASTLAVYRQVAAGRFDCASVSEALAA